MSKEQLVILPPSSLVLNGLECDLHHDFTLDTINVCPINKDSYVRFVDISKKKYLYILMRSTLRLQMACPNLDDDVGILTMIGWTHKGYPDDFSYYSLIENPDSDWDLTMVFGELLNIKIGGGLLTAYMDDVPSSSETPITI